MKLLNCLNEQQREAVTAVEGPVLVLAGAGSGKTRVLTYRLAYLMSEYNVNPRNLLGITFTKKAASEMKSRLNNLIGEQASNIWISTFHSFAYKILRREIHNLGISNNFSIFDDEDKNYIIKEVLKELKLNDEEKFSPEFYNQKISLIKNTDTAVSFDIAPYFRLVWELYNKKLKENEALDFDDLLLYNLKLWEELPEILQKYQKQFFYISVDEYQDINPIQYRLVKLLSLAHKNIFVVGDDDQSIYGFRGSNMKIILNFKNDFPDARIIKLEQNYRSTKNILKVANSLVEKNQRRHCKELWCMGTEGEKPYHYEAVDERDEAIFVVDKIKELVREKGRSYSDFAILYRIHAQSRVFEEVLLREGIPYQIIGGNRFLDRKEIKDMLAYLRYLENPKDLTSFERIVNVPRRGIGVQTTKKLLQLLKQKNTDEFSEFMSEVEEILPSRAANKVKQFFLLIHKLKEFKEQLGISEFIQKLTELTGYITEFKKSNTIEDTAKIENIEELINMAYEFEKKNPGTKLSDFLGELSLLSDIDTMDEQVGRVVLLTLHNAKGLEFPVVFMVGMEESLFPHRKAQSPEEIEEERRLCYVGITRAKEKLFFTNASRRSTYKQELYNPISRFLSKDIPLELIESNKLNKNFTEVDLNKFSRVTAKIYCQGDTVFHPLWGKGIIMLPGSIDKEEVLVNFLYEGVIKRVKVWELND